MKRILIAAAAVSALIIPAAAFAQDTGVYGTLGYAQGDYDGVDLGALQARLGYKFTPNLGVEGELAGGIKGDSVTVLGVPVDVDLKHQAAIYGVASLPVNEHAELFARVGYGTTKIKGSAGGAAASIDGDSWNYGIGGQWLFDGTNGVRADWTRHDFKDGGDNADVWSLGYVRKF